MPLPIPLREHLEQLLSTILGTPVRIEDADGVYGGSINDAYRLHTDHGLFFVKVNTADRFPSLFRSEVKGLALLREANELPVVEVLGQGEVEDSTFLLLEYIAPAEYEGRDLHLDFGRRMAKLHQHTRATFGLDHDNHIGLLPQKNAPHKGWVDFLIECRFEPLVKMAHESKRIAPGDVVRFERLYARLEDLFPPATPALLHGDLWKNNYIAAADGRVVLIDPAVYYGHPEMDLAMSRLFGGFEPAFYEGYQEVAPLAKGWEERVDLCNLYPLLVHLNLFGGSYAPRVSQVLRRYV